MAKKNASSSLSSLPASALHAELRRRQTGVTRIQRKRAKLMEQVAALDAQLRALGESPAGGGRGKRFSNEMNLADALAAALKGKTMSVPDAAAAVQKAGYRTTSANFKLMVNLQLAKDKRFKRVGRGRYTVG